MASTRMVLWLALAVLLGSLPVGVAQAQQPGPATEYTILAELVQLAADGTERTVLSATGRMGASPQGAAGLGAAGAEGKVEYGFEIGVEQFEHDAWRNLVVAAQSGCWVKYGDAPEEGKPDLREGITVKGNGMYALRTDARLQVLEMSLAEPGKPAQLVRLYLTATAE